MPEISDQQIVGSALCGFEGFVEQREMLGEVPTVNANEPITADGRGDNT